MGARRQPFISDKLQFLGGERPPYKLILFPCYPSSLALSIVAPSPSSAN
ncbi:hypothetical protein OSCI_3020046 [Kamptonema sp. PCC 6506]|nr:hypothetical protein OSCI_3020046 [Kamptonema sp. PCC 6506]